MISDVDTANTACNTVAVSDSVFRGDDRDERPLESFFRELQQGNDHTSGLNPSDFAAIIRRDRDATN